MSSKTLIATALLVFFLMAARGYAQNVTIQQPVVSNFSVGTTVSVPASGGAYIVGVGRAGSARSSFGPWRGRTSVGLSRENSSMSIHARIHDFESMDQYLLNSARSTGPVLTGRAGNAYYNLHVKHLNQTVGRSFRQPSSRTIQVTIPSAFGHRRRSEFPSTSATNNSETVSNVRAVRYFQLGINAEKRGALGVARLHYRMAAKHGSQAANGKLSALADAKPDRQSR